MYQFLNKNPQNLYTGDCVIRAIATVLNQSWEETYDGVCEQGRKMYRMPSDNGVWGEYLRLRGFYKHLIYCHECYTVKEFAEDNPKGIFVLGLDGHAVAVINGTYFDTVDSGDETVIYYWEV